MYIFYIYITPARDPKQVRFQDWRESRGGIQERNPEEESWRGALKRHPGGEARRGIQGRNPTQPGGDTAATRRHMLEAKTLIFHSFFNKNGSSLQINLGGKPPLGP